MSKKTYQFPKNFVWGTATAAAQIEGAAFEDGKGESVWDRFEKTPGRIDDGKGPSGACDHYHRYPEDAALMRKLGFPNYRLSVSWPRIYPQGTGAVQEKGLDYYDRLIDTLLKNKVTPWVTLFHWDLPQALEDKGGWPTRQVPEAFRTYCETVVKRLGDRVKNWFTVNEIPCFIGLSYLNGVHAPGRKENMKVVNQAYHHGLLAHGHAVAAIREYGGRGARVGFAHNPANYVPVMETPRHIAATVKQFEKANGQLLGPIFKGRYPAWFLKEAGADAPVVEKGDMKLIGQKLDFYGLNVYSGSFVRAREKGSGWDVLPLPKQYPQADIFWLNLVPQAAYWSMRAFTELYGEHPLYVSENGSCYDDKVEANGEVLDLDRREMLRNYLIALHRLVAEGYDLRGYFLWSFMDNFEWAHGYTKRFGIVRVDYETQKRTPKLSAHWYSQVIKENRIV